MKHFESLARANWPVPGGGGCLTERMYMRHLGNGSMKEKLPSVSMIVSVRPQGPHPVLRIAEKRKNDKASLHTGGEDNTLTNVDVEPHRNARVFVKREGDGQVDPRHTLGLVEITPKQQMVKRRRLRTHGYHSCEQKQTSASAVLNHSRNTWRRACPGLSS